MTLFDDDFEALTSREDDEGLFSRDVDGQLIRQVEASQSDYDKRVTLQIDGKSVTVSLAEPLKDAQGNVVLDIEGRDTPRYTTIFDAAGKLARETHEPVSIPVLCHQSHMKPVAVCRLCVVQIYGTKRGKRAAERKLLPACQHQVKEGMEVFTIDDPGPDGERVRRSVTCMTELLGADHLKYYPDDDKVNARLAPYNELRKLKESLNATPLRFTLPVLTQPPIESETPSRKEGEPHYIRPERRTKKDRSSPVFRVDHSACILCDRCSRACDEVKKNNVISRTGKGATAGIGFDLNDAMGESSCVQCGECMVSCPTSAITFRKEVKVTVPADRPSVKRLDADELIADPLFKDIPPKFLLWQNGLALRRTLATGEPLCQQGDAGNTAYIIKSGSLDVRVYPPPKLGASRGLLGLFKTTPSRGDPVFETVLGVKDLIAGEMACLSGQPRTADLIAREETEVWEIRRNVLDRLMRSPTQRPKIEKKFRNHALDLVLRNSEVFCDLPSDERVECTNFLRDRLSFVKVNPGQLLFQQGDWADHAYLIRLGHIRVGISRGGREQNVVFLAPGAIVGEMGLLAISSKDGHRSPDELDAELRTALRSVSAGEIGMAWPSGKRTATCSALDHVELARISRNDFLEMMLRFPTVRKRMIATALRNSSDVGSPLVRQYVAQGLYQAQSLLVLDLNSCTRCDECTRACVEKHGDESHGTPITRLLREGVRFGDSLVATSCRSCKDAYCMIGCPVDAIHRGKHQQIVIENHCIGCELCSRNCPYGNIWIHDDHNQPFEVVVAGGEKQTEYKKKAATCDLCDSEGNMGTPVPRCVNACPHDAAHRMTGAELLAATVRQEARR